MGTLMGVQPLLVKLPLPMVPKSHNSPPLSERWHKKAGEFSKSGRIPAALPEDRTVNYCLTTGI